MVRSTTYYKSYAFAAALTFLGSASLEGHNQPTQKNENMATSRNKKPTNAHHIPRKKKNNMRPILIGSIMVGAALVSVALCTKHPFTFLQVKPPQTDQGRIPAHTDPSVVPGTITQASKNQYRAGGEAACLLIVGNALAYHFKHPKESLHNTVLLDQFVQKGSDANKGSEWSDFYENVPKRCGLTIDVSSDATPLLYTEEAIKKEIEKGIQAKKQVAFVQNAQETWGLIVYDDNTFDLLDSHTRTEKGIHKAYIKRFDSVQQVVDTIVDNNLWVKSKELLTTNNDLLKQQGCVRIYWTTPVSST